ncbi:hypothetical protein [Neisseria sp. P0018.S001]
MSANDKDIGPEWLRVLETDDMCGQGVGKCGAGVNTIEGTGGGEEV